VNECAKKQKSEKAKKLHDNKKLKQIPFFLSHANICARKALERIRERGELFIVCVCACVSIYLVCLFE
jgi:hypothetical protein